MSNGTRTRADVWKLKRDPQHPNVWDPSLLWYARAVAKMQLWQAQDPTSWDFQSAVHGYQAGVTPKPNPPLPSTADQTQYWNNCQHGTWYFVSWHRAYVYFFERIVMATVQSLGGPSDWALPYWNYSESLTVNPNARKLPPEFTQQTIAQDGTPNPLWVQNRQKGNDGKDVPRRASDVDLTTCLKISPFTGVSGGDPGFGGLATTFPHHMGGSTEGRLEHQPHDVIHDDIGGFMGDPRTAALDPIFWLHHANIDRLWVVWLNGYGGQQPSNPSQSGWLSQAFTFRDGTGATVSINASQTLDTSAPPLGYQYEDTQNPLDTQAPAIAQPPVERLAVEHEQTPETVGATQSAHTLSNQPTTTEIKNCPCHRAGPSGGYHRWWYATGVFPLRKCHGRRTNKRVRGLPESAIRC